TYRAATGADGRSDGERAWLLALEQLLLMVSEERALCVVIEDVHWADDLSRRVLDGLVERLRARTQACRVLIVTTSRERTLGSPPHGAVAVMGTSSPSRS